MTKSLLLTILLSCLFLLSNGQSGCAEVDAGEDVSLDCDSGNTATLSATFLEIGETTSYDVESIDYAPPFPFDDGTNANISIDDSWGAVTPLPFTFCYFNRAQTTAQFGANGQVAFGQNYPANTGNTCAYSLTGTDNQLPTGSFCLEGNCVLNSIMVMHDMDNSPTGATGDIYSGVLGEAPCRAYVVNFNNMSHFSCSDIKTTMQIVIYENTNVIEIYIREKPVCSSFNDGLANIGILNEFGTEAYVPPDRNTSVWDTTNEAWRFRPSGNPITTFTWYDDEGNVVSNDPTTTVNPTETTTYTAEVVYNTCDGTDIIVTDELTITVEETGIDITQPDDLEVCDDDPFDGVYEFDLTSQDAIINHTSDPNLSISYHTSTTDASTGANPITNPDAYSNTSNPQTIFASVLNSTNGCRQIVQFDLIVNPFPEFNTIPPVEECDDDNDGITTFDLLTVIADIQVNATDVITLHLTESDADTGANPLPDSYQNTSNPETLWVRVDNGTGCFLTTPITIELVVNSIPEVNPGQELEECGEGTASFNLSELDDLITNDTGTTISYHPTQTDAESNTNQLPDPFDTATTTIWARVENADGCFSVVSAELIVIESPTVTLDDLFECALTTDTADFDLDAYLTNLNTPFPGINFSIHETEMDAENGIDPITGIYTNITNPQTLWVAFEDPSAPECGDVDSFDLIVQEEPGFNSIPDQEACDNNGDGDAMFNLDDLIPLIQLNPTDIVTFHPTEQDAIDGTNELIGTHETTSNPETIWVMVESQAGCRLNVPFSFDLIALAIPNVEPTLTLEQCSGTSTADFDLSVLESEITSDTDISSITFHETLTDAENGVDPLPIPYTTGSTTIYARTENLGGCQAITEIMLVVTSEPNLTLNDFEECDDDADGITQFDLDVYLATLESSFPSLMFTIHNSESDADAGTNSISGSIMNTTNPQTLWVNVIDPTAPECNGVFPFDLVVNPLPIIEPGPFSLASCDSDGSGVGVYDLSDVNEQIDPSSIYSITYHATLTDAEDNLAVLPGAGYATTATTVFARIVTTDGCFITAEVDLTVIPLPEANPASDSGCFQTAEGVFDIDLLIPTITGGATGVTVSFHRTEDDAISNVDPVSSPFNTGFDILNSTIYARVTDDATGCFDTTTIDLEIIVAPETTISDFENCEIDDTSSSTFDLDALITLIETDTGGTVSLYDTQTDAEDQLNPISGTITSLERTIWANIEIPSNPGCNGIRPVNLLINQSPPVTDVNIDNCRLSDDPNLFTFDFTTLDDSFNYTIHATETDADSGSNIISLPITTNSDFEQFFMRSENLITGCHSVSEFNLSVVDFVDNPLETTIVCYGEQFELPDGRIITDDGVFSVINLELCTNDIYDLDFQVCNPDEYCEPLMPTAFSPNVTVGSNDAFELLVPTGCTLVIERVEIFNRWGEKVYEAFGNDFSWDGSFNSNLAQQGVFVWHIDYSYIDDQGNEGEQERSGSVFIIR